MKGRTVMATNIGTDSPARCQMALRAIVQPDVSDARSFTPGSPTTRYRPTLRHRQNQQNPVNSATTKHAHHKLSCVGGIVRVYRQQAFGWDQDIGAVTDIARRLSRAFHHDRHYSRRGFQPGSARKISGNSLPLHRHFDLECGRLSFAGVPGEISTTGR